MSSKTCATACLGSWTRPGTTRRSRLARHTDHGSSGGDPGHQQRLEETRFGRQQPREARQPGLPGTVRELVAGDGPAAGRAAGDAPVVSAANEVEVLQVVALT